MAPTRQEDDIMIEHVRAELIKADEEFREATTPDAKQITLDKLERARTRYSVILLTSLKFKRAGSV